MPSILDEKDAKILEILQKDGRTTNVELARAVELTPSATLERVRKLEERGLIKGYTALLDPRALGLGLVAFIFLKVDDREDLVGQAEGTAEELAALLPDARYAEIPGTHMSSVTRPELGQAIARFLAG